MVLLASTNRYTAAADLIDQLPQLVADARTRMGLTPTVAAKSLGLSKTTLTNLEAGKTPSKTTIQAALRWLATTGGN